jgi:hypothetical protein
MELDRELHMGLNFSNLGMAGKKPDLGLWATPKELSRHVRATLDGAAVND